MNQASDHRDEESVPADGLTRIAADADETHAGAGGSSDDAISGAGIAATVSQSAVQVGDEFEGLPKLINDRYALKRFLGQGGYATVYEAWDGVLCRSVAIKIPRTERFSSKKILDEFLTEARMAARLKHKSIVAVHDVGWTADGACFIVLDFLGGGTLSEAMVRQRFAADQAALLLADVAEAVAYANEQGVVHRDLKPSNILLDDAGRPHVTDFGLAAMEESPKLRTEDVVGTPAYMAPEQVRGENHRLDGRTDLWALGVIFYQMLTGRLPFSNASGTYFDEILERDPRPPRQFVPQIPRELERLCLRCLARRMSERFAKVGDFATELRRWLDRRDHGQLAADVSSEAAPGGAPAVHDQDPQSDRTQPPEKIIPKGLRAFSTQDAGFFLQLLPGPRDRQGIPESINFWKQALEATTSEAGFAIGLLYGPSGCGKSSFLKAGLLPRLARHVTAIYLEATPDDLELRMLAAVRRVFPALPADLTLAEVWRVLRDGRLLPPDRKVVVVLDQFEQWLHAHREAENSELAQALRHCDGARVQCLLAIRDDFGMAATRFMGELEIPIVQGRNFATIDRFSTGHARKVLAEFGRAFGQLPESDADWSPAQQLFLNEAISWLGEEGKVIPVRLALFAEMVKDRAWTPATLASFGDTEGVGVAFLDEAFTSRGANPNHLRHHPAVRRILQALLPEQGTDIRGKRVQGTQLQVASGYAERPHLFDDVVRILDSELRLITPVEPNAPSSGDSVVAGHSPPGSAPHAAPNDRFYQLAHDYLVPSIRAWLTRAQRETRRGRAELQLAEQAALWNTRPSRRLLPSLWEWARLVCLTRRSDWTLPQRRMMRAATRRNSVVLAVAAGMIALAVTGVLQVRSLWKTSENEIQARHVVERLAEAEPAQMAGILRDLHNEDPALTTPLLRRLLDDPDGTPGERLRARLALLPYDPQQLEPLLEAAWDADPDHMELLIQSFERHSDEVREKCWEVAGDPSAGIEHRFRAACILARFDSNNPRWPTIAAETSRRLLEEHTLLAWKWARLLQPAAGWLIPRLEIEYGSANAPQRTRTLAADLLAGYLGDDVERLAKLIESADQEQFAALNQQIVSHRGALLPKMEAALAREGVAPWPEDAHREAWPPLPAEVQSLLEHSTGMVTATFAFCQTLSLTDFERLAPVLEASGYRPNCLRPFISGSETLVAAAWVRDGQPWRWAHDQPPAEIMRLDAEHRKAGLVPGDIACAAGLVADPDAPVRFSALWVPLPHPQFVDAKMYVGVPRHNHQDHWEPLNEAGFVPKVNLYVPSTSGEALYSSVRWKPDRNFEYADVWHVSLAEYHQDHRDRWCQSDVHLAPRRSGEPMFAATWWDSPGWETRAVHGETPDEHLTHARELADRGFRPLAVSLVERSGGDPAAASVWRRLILSEFERDALARRQANAAIALLLLDHADPVWPLFRETREPFVRTWLIHRLAANGADPRRLLARLKIETDERIQRGLLLALSRFASSSSRPLVEDELAAVARRLWSASPDSGVHSAASHLLEVFGLPPDGSGPLHATPADALAAGRRWWISPHGSTFAILTGPIDFEMGSSPNETYHESGTERLHRVRIPRTVAVSTTEVTLDQFLRSKPENFKFSRDYIPDSACPATTMTFFDALRYCRWLSEREGLSENEMCFPPLDEIHPGMSPIPDCLERTGYRLLTEAEWEYACRAGTVTSRPYGQSDELLPQYAWTFQIPPYRARAVARLLPNEFGLFDMLGNAMEYTQNADHAYQRDPLGSAVEDRFDAEAFAGTNRIRRRGGAFLFQPADARSAHRDVSNSFGPDVKFPFLGFRVARTVKHHP